MHPSGVVASSSERSPSAVGDSLNVLSRLASHFSRTARGCSLRRLVRRRQVLQAAEIEQTVLLSPVLPRVRLSAHLRCLSGDRFSRLIPRVTERHRTRHRQQSVFRLGPAQSRCLEARQTTGASRTDVSRQRRRRQRELPRKPLHQGRHRGQHAQFSWARANRIGRGHGERVSVDRQYRLWRVAELAARGRLDDGRGLHRDDDVGRRTDRRTGIYTLFAPSPAGPRAGGGRSGLNRAQRHPCSRGPGPCPGPPWRAGSCPRRAARSRCP